METATKVSVTKKVKKSKVIKTTLPIIKKKVKKIKPIKQKVQTPKLPKIKKQYFPIEVEDAIIKFNNTTDQIERDILFSKLIYPALDKLSEILINKFKFFNAGSNFDETKLDTIEFLLEKMKNYTKDKGKAFSYFTIVARNYLIIQTRINYKDMCSRSPIDYVDNSDEIKISNQDAFNVDIRSGFFELLTTYLNNNLQILFPKKNDFVVANAIMEIINKRDKLNNFNKKAIYIMIKEMTNTNSQHITKITNKCKQLRKNMYEDYLNFGTIDFKKIYLD
jgi:hypothetical protein